MLDWLCSDFFDLVRNWRLMAANPEESFSRRQPNRSPSSMGTVNWKTAPRGTFASAHNLPPCARMIERQIESPTPRPPGFIV
jgi:hypothetical protein